MTKHKLIHTGFSFIKLFLVLTLFITADFGFSQSDSKKVYCIGLDSLWSQNIYTEKLSQDGMWYTYTEVFNSESRFLKLGHISDAYSATFKNCRMHQFSNNNHWFAAINDSEELVVVDLVNHNQATYPHIMMHMFSFSESGNYLAAYQQVDDKPAGILLIDLRTRTVKSLSGVDSFTWHPTKEQLLIVKNQDSKQQVMIYDVLTDEATTVTQNSDSEYHFLTWGALGSAVFMELREGSHILYFMNTQGEIIKLQDLDVATLQAGSVISHQKPYVSEDGQKILFYRQPLQDQHKGVTAPVETWHTDDPWVYPRMQYYHDTELEFALTGWYPETGALVAIETAQTPTAALTINHDYALVYNQLENEPQYEYFPSSDLYVKHVKTGVTQLVIENQYTEAEFISISPGGNYVAYFKTNDWWVYDIKQAKTVNLTGDISADFQNFERELPGSQYPYGSPGWTEDDAHIIIYDQHDIWMMTPDGADKTRITGGQEAGMRFRIAKNTSRLHHANSVIGPGFASVALDLKTGVLLEVFDLGDYKTGYAFWGRNQEIATLLLEDQKVSQALVSKNPSTLIYCKEFFNRPRGLYRLDLKTLKETLIYQSNAALQEYDLGTFELIDYTGTSGKPLKGALVYPANFNPDKTYPMIVHIYENESKKVLGFKPPSDFTLNGFNLLKYITNGYFVFYPDFEYIQGDPGVSALQSVTTAVNTVLERGHVDAKRMGLIGHSFGGYETAFIVTQTNLFAAAVAGAAVTDLKSYYHDVSWDNKQNQMWRMENQQWRMGKSFYQAKNAYYRNSPLHQIEGIETPLLLWTGKLDTNVNWSQSVYLFMGLKRLGKKGKLLLFDNEFHFISHKMNQRLLTQDIYEWMELHLKRLD